MGVSNGWVEEDDQGDMEAAHTSGHAETDREL